MDLVIRAIVIFFFIFLITRVAGRRERITLADIEEEARGSQIASLADLEWAILENDGRISCIPRRG